MLMRMRIGILTQCSKLKRVGPARNRHAVTIWSNFLPDVPGIKI
jgi:hypothetical protein